MHVKLTYVDELLLANLPAEEVDEGTSQCRARTCVVITLHYVEEEDR